jgi:hypothetical protein
MSWLADLLLWWSERGKGRELSGLTGEQRELILQHVDKDGKMAV